VLIFAGPPPLLEEKAVTVLLVVMVSLTGAGLDARPAGVGDALGAAGEGEDVGEELGVLLPVGGGLGDGEGVAAGLGLKGGVPMISTGLSTAWVSGS
jgi:hypothetical protein